MFHHGRPLMLQLTVLSLCIVAVFLVSVTNAGPLASGQFDNELVAPAPLPEKSGVHHLHYVVGKGGRGGGKRRRGGGVVVVSGSPLGAAGYGGGGNGNSGAAVKFGSGCWITLALVVLLGGFVVIL